MITPSAGAELARQAPLGAVALYMNFVSDYGAAIVTTLAVIYGVMQIVLRIMEHRKIMKSGDPE